MRRRRASQRASRPIFYRDRPDGTPSLEPYLAGARTTLPSWSPVTRFFSSLRRSEASYAKYTGFAPANPIPPPIKRSTTIRPCGNHNGFDPDVRLNHVRDRSVQIHFVVVRPQG